MYACNITVIAIIAILTIVILTNWVKDESSLLVSTNRNQIYFVDCLGMGRFGGEVRCVWRGVEIFGLV